MVKNKKCACFCSSLLRWTLICFRSLPSVVSFCLYYWNKENTTLVDLWLTFLTFFCIFSLFLVSLLREKDNCGKHFTWVLMISSLHTIFFNHLTRMKIWRKRERERGGKRREERPKRAIAIDVILLCVNASSCVVVSLSFFSFLCFCICNRWSISKGKKTNIDENACQAQKKREWYIVDIRTNVCIIKNAFASLFARQSPFPFSFFVALFIPLFFLFSCLHRSSILEPPCFFCLFHAFLHSLILVMVGIKKKSERWRSHTMMRNAYVYASW